VTASSSTDPDESVPGYVPLAEAASDDDALWSFTVALYRKDGVETCCLEWQRHYDVDISFLFWAGWLQFLHRIFLTQEELHGALAVVTEWRSNIIAPVRDSRLYLKASGLSASDPEFYTNLRRHLRNAELAAERHEQHLLIDYASTLSRDRADNDGGSSNMARYLRLVSGRRFEREQARMQRIDRLAAEIAQTTHE
jgi:uncharacterized protein (TIGR02444 family)